MFISGGEGSSCWDFPRGEGISGVFRSEGTEEWEEGMEEAVDAVSSWEGAEAADEVLLVDTDLRWARLRDSGGGNSGYEAIRFMAGTEAERRTS
jgi:hypothetical protein